MEQSAERPRLADLRYLYREDDGACHYAVLRDGEQLGTAVLVPDGDVATWYVAGVACRNWSEVEQRLALQEA